MDMLHVCIAKPIMEIRPNEIVVGYYRKVALNGETKHYIYTFDNFAVEVDPSTVCRCTGVQDINDKWVFENDKVKYTEICMRTGKDKNYKGRIVWDAPWHQWGVQISKKNVDSLRCLIDSIEVIDNPELLGGAL